MISTNPAAKAWSWSKAHSPILNAWRWLIGLPHRQARASDAIRSANLPDPIARRIEQITRRTRLWSSERAEIARELIAHAQDAGSADRGTDDILTALGDPRTIARLLRRASKRKRPWLWQIRHRTLQAILCTLGLTLALYTVLFIRFNAGSPKIARHAIAELNERNAGFTEDQHALPALESLWIEWTKERNRLNAIQEADRERIRQNTADPLAPDEEPPAWAFDMRSRATPEHAGYDEYRAFIARIEPEIDAAARASRLPTIGGVYSDDSEAILYGDTEVWVTRPIPPSPDPAAHGSMIGVLLPWLGQARVASNILLTDAVFAAQAADAERAAARIEASLRYASLSADDGFVISHLVGIAIQRQTESDLLRLLADRPELFTDTQLARLSHLLSVVAEHTQHISMSGERAVLEDVLQRSFTDDGHGDGRLTAKGFEELAGEILNLGTDSPALELIGTEAPSASARFIGPVSLLMVASRAEHQRLYDDLISIIEPALDPSMPAAEALARGYEYNNAFTKRVQDSERFPILDVLAPNLEKAIQTAHDARAHTHATLLAIAAHIHHRRTGTWPTNAEQLVPALLPALPEDPFDPGRPLKLLVRDGQPVVYSAGSDGDDDRASPLQPDDSGSTKRRAAHDLSARYPNPNPEPGTRPKQAPDADWIIFPSTE